jgi:phosphoglucosamine mutase
MTKKFFGTDGIRGVANSFPITPDIILKIGMAVGIKFTSNQQKSKVVIGKDTRLSGYMIEQALTSGLVSVGLDVFLVGPVPTPAVAMLTKSLRADAGIMISASHNPYQDNGIKIFHHNGNKLNDQTEHEIEKLILQDLNQHLAPPINLGKVKRIDDAKGRYIEFVKNSFPKQQSLTGLKIIIDCANGACYNIAPTVLRELGANVLEIGTTPDGFNINNNCGSTKPQALQEKVLTEKADIGIALDGDADRLLIVDDLGNIVEGDKLIAIIAEKLHNEGKLKQDTVAITQMSNLALENYLNYIGINIIRTNIGDRYILEAMQKYGYNFGGEQSGHLILSNYSTTGDGLLASLQVLSALITSKQKMHQLANIFIPNPQILENIVFTGKNNPLLQENIQNFIHLQQKKLGNQGRILVRKSGTENLIRIMVEGDKLKEIQKIAKEISQEIYQFNLTT